MNGHIPIWVGGDTEPAFRRAARYGDAYHAAFEPLEAVTEHWARVKALARECGRDPSALTLSIRVYLSFEGMTDPAKSLSGSPARMREQVARFSEAGVRTCCWMS